MERKAKRTECGGEVGWETRLGAAPLLLMVLLAALGLLVAAPSPASAQEVSDVPDPTAQTDGVVFAVLPLGGRIYIGGDFANVDGTPRANLAALDASTGQLTDWNPGANGRVAALAASADGARVYVGGSFSSVGGVTRNRAAALEAGTGAVSGWNPNANSTVRALAVSGARVYLGGSFTRVKGQTRERLALVDASTGEPNPTWTPTVNDVDDHVRALALSPDGGRLYAGGDFSAVSGQARPYLVALNAATGAVDPWKARPNTNGTVFALAVAGTRVYAAEGGTGGAAASYDAGTGNLVWKLSGDGDGQAITVLGTKVYFGGHFVDLVGQVRPFFAAADAAGGTLDSRWAPSGGGGRLSLAYNPGVWALLGDATRGRVYAGTNFATVWGKRQAGFVQFSKIIPPPDSTAPTVGTVSPADAEQNVPLDAKVEAMFSEAMDPSTLNETTFTLTKDGGGAPVAATVSYDGISDTATLVPASDLEAGKTYTARVTTGVKDLAGNVLVAAKVWSFTTTPPDTTAPQTSIDSGPSGTVNSASATFSFSSNETGSAFKCSLDGAALSACTSPKEYTGLNDGSHTFKVTATDTAGNTGEATLTWTVDTKAPTVSAPVENLVSPSQVGVSTTPVKLDWSAADTGGSGVARYELQQSVNGGSHTNVVLPSPTATTITSPLSPDAGGTTYQFQVRAQDKAGNWSAWTSAVRFVMKGEQETSPSITYYFRTYLANWTSQTLSGSFGNNTKYASATSFKATFKFTGDDVVWITNKSTTRGQAEVWIDGVKATTVDLYSPTLQLCQAVFRKSWPTAGIHTVEVRVLGTKNAAALGTRVDVEGFVTKY